MNDAEGVTNAKTNSEEGTNVRVSKSNRPNKKFLRAHIILDDDEYCRQKRKLMPN